MSSDRSNGVSGRSLFIVTSSYTLREGNVNAEISNLWEAATDFFNQFVPCSESVLHRPFVEAVHHKFCF
jgi:hypothetical protein